MPKILTNPFLELEVVLEDENLQGEMLGLTNDQEAKEKCKRISLFFWLHKKCQTNFSQVV